MSGCMKAGQVTSTALIVEVKQSV